jgi:hypothetical protein
MPQYCIRFNKTRGQVVWRVFEGNREYIVKHVEILVPSRGEKTGEDWSICCEGELTLDRQTSTATIKETRP